MRISIHSSTAVYLLCGACGLGKATATSLRRGGDGDSSVVSCCKSWWAVFPFLCLPCSNQLQKSMFVSLSPIDAVFAMSTLKALTRLHISSLSKTATTIAVLQRRPTMELGGKFLAGLPTLGLDPMVLSSLETSIQSGSWLVTAIALTRLKAAPLTWPLVMTLFM